MIKTCSIWSALEVVGDKPVLLILEAVWMGARRFSELETRTGLLKAMLSNRLKRLRETDILERRPSSVPGRKRQEYALTRKGIDLFDTVMALYRWENDWDTGRRESFQLVHTVCDHSFTPEHKCGACGETYALTDIEWEEGPGVGWTENRYQPRRASSRPLTNRPSLLEGSVNILGDRWSALIMREIFTGNRRFDTIANSLSIGTRVLSERLKNLQGTGIISMTPYQEKPVRFDYNLTCKGYDYYHVIIMLIMWGDSYYASENGPPVILTHKSCGQTLMPQQTCSHCHETLSPEAVVMMKSCPF